MKVLQVLGRSAGGIARHVARIVESLDGKDGLDVAVAGQADTPVPLPRLEHDLVIPRGPLLGHRGAIARLRAIIERGGYDVVHAHGLRAGIDAGLAAGDRAYVVVTVHNLVEPEMRGRLKAPLYRRSERLVVRLGDRIIAISEQIADRLRATAREPGASDKIELLHLGVGAAPRVVKPTELVRSELGVEDGRRLLVTAARLRPQKALPVMIRSLEWLPEAVLAIAGEGPLRSELEKVARDEGLSERVRFLGFRDDVADVVAAGDVFVLSSAWEGVPLAAQEAILLGTPVVGTDVGGMSELIEDGVSGRLVPRDDPRVLASAVGEVLRSPEVAAAYSEAARRRLESDFSTRAMLDRIETIYRERPR